TFSDLWKAGVAQAQRQLGEEKTALDAETEDLVHLLESKNPQRKAASFVRQTLWESHGKLLALEHPDLLSGFEEKMKALSETTDAAASDNGQKSFREVVTFLQKRLEDGNRDYGWKLTDAEIEERVLRVGT